MGRLLAWESRSDAYWEELRDVARRTDPELALASGIGAAIGAARDPQAANPILALLAGVVGAVVGWAVVTGFVYLVGTRLFGGTATWGEVLRTVGFANAPGVLNILGFIPVLGGLVRFVVAI